MHDGGGLPLQHVDSIVAGDAALHVVVGDRPEQVLVARRRHLRVRGVGHLRHAAAVIDVRGRDGDAAVEMGDHRQHAVVVAEALRDQRALLGIALVVQPHQHHLAAADAAGVVDLLDRQLGAVHPGGPEIGLRARGRAGHADLDVVGPRAVGRRQHGDRRRRQ